jgi:hypothetical protein
MSRKGSVLAVLALAFLPGCIFSRVRDEVPLDQEKIQKIVPGQSTKKDVVELLGAPNYVNDRLAFRVVSPRTPQAGYYAAPLVDELVRSPLDHSYTYEYTDTKSFSLYLLVVSFTNQETKRDRVTVFVDGKGVVSHMGVTLNSKDVEFRLPTSN